MTENSKGHNKAVENINKKLLETMIDRDKIASYLMSPLSKITNSETTGQIRIVKDHKSIRVIDFLIHNLIPIFLYNNLLTFRDTGKKFELRGDLLKKIAPKNYNIDLGSLLDKKLM